MELYKPQEGTWTLTAPDGRQWQAESGLLAAAKEQHDRIPPSVMLERIMAGIAPTEEELDAARYRWLKENREVMLLTGFFGNGCVNRSLEEVDAVIDAAMSPNEQK